jgi:hypothetical protein
MTERKMIIGSIPILHEFVYNIYNLKSFAKMKDYQEIDTRSDNWLHRYPEEPEMSLNREFDAICNRIYKMVPTVPFAFDVPNLKWDKVQYWSTDYTAVAPSPPGEEYTEFICRRRRRLHPVKVQIEPPRKHPLPPSPGQTAIRGNSSTGHQRRR